MKQKKQPSNNVLAFFNRHAAGQRRWLVLAVASTLVGVAASFLMPQVIRFAVDGALGGAKETLPGYMQALFAWFGSENNLRAVLLGSALGVVALAVTSGVFTFLSRWAIAVGTERFCKNLRERLFHHIQHLPFQWQVENQTGDIIQRCTSDLDVVRNFAAQQLLEVARTVALIGVALALMFSMDLSMALVAAAFIPLIGLYSIIFYRLVGSRFRAADEAEGALTVNVQENLTGVRVVRAFGREKFELDRFDRYNNRFARLWIRLGHVLGVYWGIGDIATGLQVFTVILVGVVEVVKGGLTAGEFLVFVFYSQSLAWPVRSLGRTLSEMSKTGVSAQRIQDILDAEEEAPEPDALKPPLDGDIVFDNVSFSYGELPVLKNVSFTIRKGSTFGVLGATGSGKSTLTYLLNRLYDLPDGCGCITIGGVDIRRIDRRYLRQHIGLVLQEPYLFSQTIEENIAIAAKETDALPDEVRRAAAVAAVDDAINEFAKGYNTVVGERGVTLSGGQKQRVAIARTLMLKAPVMIFDDSLSAVDLETDGKIRAALREDTRRATVVLISHRINTLMTADTIVVLENGAVADIGTHRELVCRKGAYRRIYEMQSAAAADAGESLERLAGLPESREEQRHDG